MQISLAAFFHIFRVKEGEEDSHGEEDDHNILMMLLSKVTMNIVTMYIHSDTVAKVAELSKPTKSGSENLST